jgi:GNAT superfamily N-acetyltransferase
MVRIATFDVPHLAGVLALCEREGWSTYPADPDRARIALLAPGAVTVVAVEGNELGGEEVLGFAHAFGDGLRAYLSELLTARHRRGEGIGRALVSAVFERTGAARLDLVTDTAEDFYAALPHRRFTGFRLYRP